MIRKAALAVAAALVLLVAVLLANTWRQGSRQLTVAPVAPLAVDANAAAERLVPLHSGFDRFRPLEQ